MQIRIMLVAGLMLVPTWGAAQTADAPPQLTLDQARAQRSKARDMKAEARKTHDAEIKACQRQAIAIRCISSAKEKREETLKRAEALELEGRTVEREALRREAEAKAAKREAEAAKRQAREPADVERYRKNEAERAAERERRQAGEPARLESSRNRVAAEKAAREKKLEKQKQKDARQAAAAADRAREKEHFAVGGQVVGHLGRQSDTQVHIGALRNVASNPGGHLVAVESFHGFLGPFPGAGPIMTVSPTATTR